MSINITASKVEIRADGSRLVSPVVDYKHWDQEIDLPNADDLIMQGLPYSVPNPDYLPDTHIQMSGANALYIFEGVLGLELDESGMGLWTIDAFEQALSQANAVDGYAEQKLPQLNSLVSAGRARGASHISVA